MKKSILLFVASLIICSCTDNSDLGDSYYYLDSFEAIDVGFPNGAIIYKSKKKHQFDSIVISKEVVYAIHSNRFIFAKQLSNEQKRDTNYYIIDKLNDKIYRSTSIDSCDKLKRYLKTDL